MEFLFIRKTSLQVQDIWKDGEFSKWLLSPLDQKSFQELVFNAFENRKHSCCIDRQQVWLIDWNLFFFKLKLLMFRRWWQLWMKATTIKQRYQMNLFFVVFSSFVLLLNSMSKLIDNWCTYHWNYGCICVCTRTIASVFLCFSPLFCSPSYSPLKIILKQLFVSGSVNIGEYIFISTLSRWIFTNVHFAFGK